MFASNEKVCKLTKMALQTVSEINAQILTVHLTPFQDIKNPILFDIHSLNQNGKILVTTGIMQCKTEYSQTFSHTRTK